MAKKKTTTKKKKPEFVISGKAEIEFHAIVEADTLEEAIYQVRDDGLYGTASEVFAKAASQGNVTVDELEVRSVARRGEYVDTDI